MTYHRHDEQLDGGATAVTAGVLAIVALVFAAIGIFIGYLVFSPVANAMPAPCAELRSECAAVMEAR